MQELTYYKRIKKLDDLTQKERDFLERYYGCGNKSLAKMFPNDAKERQRWANWLHNHKPIINRIERKSCQSLLVDVSAAKSYIQKETICLINRLKQEPVLKAAKQIISALDLLGRVSGIGTAQQAELDSIRQEQGDLLSRLSDEQIDKLSKLVSDSVAKIGYQGADVAEVVVGASVSASDDVLCDVVEGIPPTTTPHHERAESVPLRECLVATDIENLHSMETASDTDEPSPMSMTPTIPLK